ncbi:hypothetical protein JOB18_036293 [Solea senegalensis]|uniref:Uncharacterized protein n=1 Tax=Solea senegalensis TaxID=28829 RepID=A0AAV6PTN0_SOLSE|nr:hypothetical protein JOB18_036293 [Solea senegalensis]
MDLKLSGPPGTIKYAGSRPGQCYSTTSTALPPCVFSIPSMLSCLSQSDSCAFTFSVILTSEFDHKLGPHVEEKNIHPTLILRHDQSRCEQQERLHRRAHGQSTGCSLVSSRHTDLPAPPLIGNLFFSTDRLCNYVKEAFQPVSQNASKPVTHQSQRSHLLLPRCCLLHSGDIGGEIAKCISCQMDLQMVNNRAGILQRLLQHPRSQKRK